MLDRGDVALGEICASREYAEAIATLLALPAYLLCERLRLCPLLGARDGWHQRRSGAFGWAAVKSKNAGMMLSLIIDIRPEAS